jgi:two-component system, cell cycle response regulator
MSPGDRADAPRGFGIVPITTLVVDAPPPSIRSLGVLTVLVGVDTGRVLSIPASTIVRLGRSEECTYRFEDPSVSGVHAHLVQAGGRFVIADAPSRAGTYVNDVRLSGSHALVEGDRIRLGAATLLRFSIVDEAEEAELKNVYESALHDGLTGTFNRKYLDERLEAEVKYAVRHRTELSIVLLDLDWFKSVNDTHGHLAGDAVLKAASKVFADAIRSEDVLTRFGGEEFVVIARAVHLEGAVILAERLRETLARAPIAFGPTAIPVTVSGGVASLRCCGDRPERSVLLGLADARLYRAKEGGRDRIVGSVSIAGVKNVKWSAPPPK